MQSLNMMRLEESGQHLADVFESHSFEETSIIFAPISLQFVLEALTDNESSKATGLIKHVNQLLTGDMINNWFKPVHILWDVLYMFPWQHHNKTCVLLYVAPCMVHGLIWSQEACSIHRDRMRMLNNTLVNSTQYYLNTICTLFWCIVFVGVI